ARLGGLTGVSWSRPEGGYFIGLALPPGHAKRVVALAGEAGLVLTPAGAVFPYREDPDDSYLRIAPSFPSLDEVRLAADAIAVSVRRALELD
ncbi:aminotransferase, partial [Burkholderia gladioli]|nr:aminotransferase [Burkholderia gladioli]